MTEWFIKNKVVANGLMLLILLSGLWGAMTVQKRLFPKQPINYIRVSAVFPGASPSEVESAITRRVESALHGVQGIDQVLTKSQEGVMTGWIYLQKNVDVEQVLQNVKRPIDAITTFPSRMENLQVVAGENTERLVTVSVYGDVSRLALREYAEQLRSKLRLVDGVADVDMYGGPSLEFAIDVSQLQLSRHQLSLADVASAVRNNSVNMAAGSIKTVQGDILVRSRGEIQSVEQLSAIPIKSYADGSQLLLRDIASVQFNFADQVNIVSFNGLPSISLAVMGGEHHDLYHVVQQTENLISNFEKELPTEIRIDSWGDTSKYLDDRLSLMIENLVLGGLLVAVMLICFMPPQLALWVVVGLPVCFLGPLAFLASDSLAISINMVSLFGFILIIGLVVDDSIIVAESIHHQTQKGLSGQDAASAGLAIVKQPALFGVLTTIAAFTPLLFGDPEMNQVAWVVVIALGFSIVESKLILPSHLTRLSANTEVSKRSISQKFQQFSSSNHQRMNEFYQRYVARWVLRCFSNPKSTILGFAVFLTLILALVATGVIRYAANPVIPHDYPKVELSLYPQASKQDAERLARELDQAFAQLTKQTASNGEQSPIKHYQVWVDSQYLVEGIIELDGAENRQIDTFELADKLRALMPVDPVIKGVHIKEQLFGDDDSGSYAVAVVSDNLQDMLAAAEELKAQLRSEPALYNVRDNLTRSTDEIQLSLKPIAHSLGLTLQEVSNQVRFGIYGNEVQRIMRGDEEVKVMVRLAQTERHDFFDLHDFPIRLPSGVDTHLSEVATITFGPAIDRIYRVDSELSLSIFFDIEPSHDDAGEVYRRVREQIVPQVIAEFSGVEQRRAGRQRTESKQADDQAWSMSIALLLVFILIAIPLQSYWKPLLIMIVIPFGFCGAVLGHALLGLDLSRFSIFGVIALAGVTVNDSLILIARMNSALNDGQSLKTAVLEAVERRFMAIFLTSISTFFGLLPMLLETSLQALMVIPMAVSLAFGILVSTITVLLLVPALSAIFLRQKNLTTQ